MIIHLVAQLEFSKLLELIYDTKFFGLLNKFKKMNQCPRCKLPQNGIYKCQYCGYDLNKYNKKPTTIIRKRLKDIFGGFKKGQIVSSDKKRNVRTMKNTGKAKKSTDHFGSRSGTERRQQKNTTYFPERRSGMDRRK
jgi:ribosomal protein L37AE/L43A